jgi:hypothetical protein
LPKSRIFFELNDSRQIKVVESCFRSYISLLEQDLWIKENVSKDKRPIHMRKNNSIQKDIGIMKNILYDLQSQRIREISHGKEESEEE